jgi:hypothetical protein
VETLHEPVTVPTAGVAAADSTVLRWAAALFTAVVLVHNADHVRRGIESLSTEVFVVGSLAILPEVLIVLAIFRGDRTAPLMAVGTGLSLAAGYVVVHMTPERGWLSDSFVSNDVSAFSWAAASLEIAAAVALALAGLVVVRERGGIESAFTWPASPRPIAAALAHPVVAAMVAGNAVILVLSLIER